MVGQSIGHYKILEKLGAGGMGEVYRAEDTTLDREVALKVLPPELAESQERLDRFQREAKTLAALDHPNIVTIHTVESAAVGAPRAGVEENVGEGLAPSRAGASPGPTTTVRFLTMQLVEGQRLSELIPKGGMPLERIFEIAIPLADALSAAHDKGVIHRDLKPANIMLSDEGRVKVLDFGLAKLRPDLDATVATELPTEPLTGEGRILGTVPYMSPEQVEGKPIDHRSDLFSLGVILYELATGERPFRGDTSVSVISSIVKDQPRPVDAVKEELPHHLGRIIRRCLEKEPKRRYQSALEVSNELEDLKAEAESGELWARTGPVPPTRSPRLWAWVLSAAAVVMIGLVGYLIVRSRVVDSESFPATPSALAGTHSQLTFESGPETDPSFSPDGGSFVFSSHGSGNWDIYFRRVSGGKVLNLTEGSLEDDLHPVFSPDGNQIAFRSERNGGGIFVMGAMGEDVRQLTDFGYFPAWSPDGEKIVLSTGSWRYGSTADQTRRIWTVDVVSGELQEVLDHSALQPDWSPNGQRIAFCGVPSEKEAGYDIFTIPAAGGEPVAVTQDSYRNFEPEWSPDGGYLYFRSNRGGTENLWRVPIDEETGEALGEAEPVTAGTSEGVGGISIARDGNRLAYFVWDNPAQINSVAFDPEAERVIGDATPVTPQGLDALLPSVSPDGEWIAFAGVFAGGGRTIGVVRTDGTGLRQLTERDAKGRGDLYPAWSPDGQRIAYFGARSGSREVWVVQRDGSGLRQLTDVPGKTVLAPKWSPDGRRLVTAINYGSAFVFDADKPWTEQPPTELPHFDAGEGTFWRPWSWSPDGSLIAGNIHGKINVGGIVLFSFDTGEYRQVTDFGWNPLWLADSRRLLFVDSDEPGPFKLYLLDTETGEFHQVMSAESLGIAPDRINSWPAISPDSRTIFFDRISNESDIWMLTLGGQE